MEENNKINENILYAKDEDNNNSQDKENIEQKEFLINDSLEEKEVKISTDNQGSKEYNTNVLLLNEYWVELISKISFGLSIIIYEIIGLIAFSSFFSLIQGDIDDIKKIFVTIFQDIGLKWLFIVNTCQHLSIGFFCLTNVSKVINEKKNFHKFYISNFIKCIIFYLISAFILQSLINNYMFGSIIDEVNKVDNISEDGRGKILEVINKLKKIAVRYFGDLLSNYNNSLDKLLVGSLYYILFSPKRNFKKKNKIYFRLLSIFPITYIILSLIFRALNNLGIIYLSPFVSPIFGGPKFTIYGFFISFLLYIKLKVKKYKMLDEEGDIMPSVFAKASSQIFSIFGLIELYTGLFHHKLSAYGIGTYYLLILCAPIMILYDYKKKYELRIRPCVKQNFGNCVNISTSIILYGTALIAGFFLFIAFMSIFKKYVKPLVEIVIKNFKNIIQLIDMIYTSSSP